MTGSRDLALGEVSIDVLQVLLKFLQAFSLRHIVRKLLDVAQPHLLILPVYVSHGFHVAMLAPPIVRFNDPFYLRHGYGKTIAVPLREVKNHEVLRAMPSPASKPATAAQSWSSDAGVRRQEEAEGKLVSCPPNP